MTRLGFMNCLRAYSSKMYANVDMQNLAKEVPDPYSLITYCRICHGPVQYDFFGVTPDLDGNKAPIEVATHIDDSEKDQACFFVYNLGRGAKP